MLITSATNLWIVGVVEVLVYLGSLITYSESAALSSPTLQCWAVHSTEVHSAF